MSTGGVRYGYDDYDESAMAQPQFPVSVMPDQFPAPVMPASVVEANDMPAYPEETTGAVPEPIYPGETVGGEAGPIFRGETAAAPAFPPPTFTEETAGSAAQGAFPVKAADESTLPVEAAEEAQAAAPKQISRSTIRPRTTMLPADVLRDLAFWRDKKLSLGVLVAATAAWVVLQVLEFNFLPVVSWLGIATLTPLFVWANLTPLFRMDPPELFDWEVSAQSAVDKANALRIQLQDSATWLLQKMADRDWRVFLQSTATLLVLSWLGSVLDFLTLLFVGVVMGLTIPPLYTKYEDRIKSSIDMAKEKGRKYEESMKGSMDKARVKYGESMKGSMDKAKARYGESMKGSMEKAREQGKRYRNLFDDKVWNKVGRTKVAVKDKKTE